MKEENLRRAEDVVGELAKLRQKIKYLESKDTAIEVQLYHKSLGGDRVNTAHVSEATCAATKALLLIDAKGRIKELEIELATL